MRPGALLLRTGSGIVTGLLIVGFVLASAPLDSQLFRIDDGVAVLRDAGSLSISGLRRLGDPSEPPAVSLSMDPHFVENRGQMGEGGGLFAASGRELSVALGIGWMSYLVHEEGNDEACLVRVEFEGCIPCRPEGLCPLERSASYFLGGSPGQWFTDAHSYEEVVYERLWEGIEMRLFFVGDKLKYEFLVAPGADPSRIVLNYSVPEGLRTDPITGDLVVETSGGVLRDSHPTSYQVSDSVRYDVPCSFMLGQGGEVGFHLGEFDVGRPLLIDPGIAFSTYLGGDSSDESAELFVDDHGDIYLLGSTYSSDFPITAGAYKRNETEDGGLFVLKMDMNLSRIEFSAFIGCDGPLVARGLHVDPQGYIYVICHPGDPTFPVTSGAYDTSFNGRVDCAIVKMEPNATGLVYSTFVGGSMWDFPFAIAADGLGNAIVAGTTYSSDFPTTDDAYDDRLSGITGGFLLKLNHEGSDLVYSTFIDGVDTEEIEDILVSPRDEVYLLGTTTSNNFPTTLNAFDRTFNGWVDVFFMAFNISASRIMHSTFIGGTGLDSGYDMALDDEGDVLVVGVTYSTNFPRTPNAYDRQLDGDTDGFALRLRTADWRIEYSTLLGGRYDDYLLATCVDGMGRANVVGYTDSSDFPTTSGAHSSRLDGGQDAVLAVLSKDGSDLSYSTFIGGSDVESLVGIAMDTRGLPIMVGWTYSNDYPTTPGTYDRSVGGLRDCVVTTMDLVNPEVMSANVPPVLTTGDPFRFTVNVTDNMDVEEVVLEHWYGNDSVHTNTSFVKAPGGVTIEEWHADLIAPPDRVDELHYILKVTDVPGNVNSSINGTIPLVDNDAPRVWMAEPPPEGYGADIRLVGEAIDNIDIQVVRLYYRFGARDVEEVEMTRVPDTTSYAVDIESPVGFLGPLGFHMMAADGTDNVNSTEWFSSTVHDYQRAELVKDLSDTNATTGDPFRFEVEVMDNIGVSVVHVNIWYGGDGNLPPPSEVLNASLLPLEVEELGNGTYVWGGHVTPMHSLEAMHYLFDLQDLSGIWNRTGTVSIPTMDNDPPVVVEDLSSLPVTTGDPFELLVRLCDNIGIADAIVHHNVPGPHTSWVRMSAIDIQSITNGTYGAILDIPLDWRGPLNLTLELRDINANVLETDVWVLEVVDDEAPRIISWDCGPGRSPIKGLDCLFTAQADDNIGAPHVHLEVWTQAGNRTNTTMTLDLDASPGPPFMYKATVTIPRNWEGLFFFRFLAVDEQGNWNSTKGDFVDRALNLPPDVEALPTWSVTEGEESRLNLSPYVRDGNDPDDALEIIVDHPSLSSDGLILIALVDVWVGEIVVPIAVTDGENSTEAHIVLIVRNVNDPPVILNITPRMGSAFRHGQTIHLSGNASDEEGDVLTYTWMDDNVLLGVGETLSVDDLSPGVHVITLIVTDGIDNTAMSTELEVGAEPDGGMPWWGVATAAVIVVVVVAIVLLFMRFPRRGDEVRDEDPYGPRI